jgi:SPP1 gp7 family putative phage head morphogenesis protein
MAFNIPQTLRQLNPFKRSGATESKKSIRSRMLQVQVHRVKQDVGKWRAALDQAENVYFPNRTDLLNIYADLVLDPHLSSVMETRLINVLSRPFKLQNEAGEENTKATRLLKKPWFRKFCTLALERIYYGHSLLEFPLPVKGEFKDVDLVPRQYVSPELGIVRTMPGMITGTDFRTDPAFTPWLIEIGDATDLGLLNKVATMALYKKNVMAAWADFTEVFGMPFRAVTTDAEGAELEEIERIVAEMGQASWGVFPTDVKIEFISAATANEQLYDLFIERTNSEMSKVVLGQTMTTDSGSSRSQGEVHERVAASYTRADSEMLLSIINEQLLPFLQSHGYQVQGLEFAWDESEQLSKPELFKIAQGVMTSSGYKMSRAWLESTFGIELEPEPAVATGAAGPDGAPVPGTELPPILGYHIEAGVVDRNEARARLMLPEQDESEAISQRKLKGQLSVLAAATTAGIPLEAALKLAGLELPAGTELPGAADAADEAGPDDDKPGPGGSGGPGRNRAPGGGPGKPEGSAAAEQRSPTAQLQALYGGHRCSSTGSIAQLQASAADDKALQALIERLIGTIYAGANDAEGIIADLPLYELIYEQLGQAIEVAWDSPDAKLKTFLKKNVQRFSGFKSARVCREMTQKLYDAEGKIRDFAAFKADALQVNQLYNVAYLKTEYEQAVAGAQMASKWSTFEPEALLQYRTVGDDLVRPEHRRFDGVTLPASHAFWDTHYPPNDWNCRCDAVDLVDDEHPHTSAAELAGLPDVPSMFANNVGKAGEVFGKEHPYFDVPKAEKKQIETQLKLNL